MDILFKIKSLSLVIIVCLLSSCESFNSSGHLVGRYYLQENEFGKSLCYKVDDVGCIELINGTFNDIAYDENYIVMERAVNQYFIVEVYEKLNYFPEKGVIGPLSLKEYLTKKRLMKIKVYLKVDYN